MAEPCFPSQLKEFPFTQDEVVAIWKYAKENYIDKGSRDIEDTIAGVSKDLGLRRDWVARALTRNKSIKPMTLDMYRKISDRNLAVRQAKDMVRGIDTPNYKNVIHAIKEFPRSLAVFGHGTVGMITHAGANIFRPTAWRTYWPNFIRQFKFMTNSGVHQMAMDDLVSSDNFNLGKKAGLANDPATIYTDYGKYAKFFGAEWGRRGFDALKVLRQETFDQFWQKVPESIKADPEAALDMAKSRAEAINHATGVITMRQDSFLSQAAKAADPVTFAAKLEASRWARIIGDPIKTIDTFANWKNATAGERSVALARLGHAAEFTSFLVATLALNESLLNATGSDNHINFDDPAKSDWLKHKIFGYTVALDGGLLMPVRLLGELVFKDFLGTKAQRRGDTKTTAALKDLGYYAMGKANPAVEVGKELLTGEDFTGREVPFSLPKAVRSIKGEDEPTSKPGKEPLTVTEYALSHGPIPLSGATKEIYNEFRQDGMTAVDTLSLLRGLAIFGAESTGAKVQAIKPEATSSGSSSVPKPKAPKLPKPGL